MLDYEIFFRFYEKFKAQSFLDIDPNDPVVLEMEEKLLASGQFFHIADLINLKILYVCKRCHHFFGLQCGEVDPSTFVTNIHPNDQKRFGVSRSRVFRMASEMYYNTSENLYVSSHYKTKAASGEFHDILFQLAIMHSEIPHKTVHHIHINTDVTELLSGKYGYHYYFGNDKSYFRYPDQELLSTGNVFSEREFEIIRGIAEGLESREIAEKLFLSVHTVNTHRRNILTKTGKRTTHELVIELQETGMI